MKKIILLLSFLIIITISWNCKTTPVNENANASYQVDPENCETTIKLKISDLMDSCRLVQLETTNESILGNYFYFTYIDEDIILIADRTGVF